MSTTILSDSQTERTSTAELSNRLLARRSFDNMRQQRACQRRWANLLELMRGEIGNHALLDWRGHQLTEISIRLAQLELEAAEINVEFAHRRLIGGSNGR